MTVEEVNKAFDELRAQGADDEGILGVLYLMYQEDKLDTNQLREMVDILGYEFTPEFEAMSEEDKHAKGFEEDEEAADGISKEEIEDAKETEGNEPKNDNEEDNKGSESEDKPQPPKAANKPQGEEGKDDENDERKQAMKLFGFNK